MHICRLPIPDLGAGLSAVSLCLASVTLNSPASSAFYCVRLPALHSWTQNFVVIDSLLLLLFIFIIGCFSSLALFGCSNFVSHKIFRSPGRCVGVTRRPLVCPFVPSCCLPLLLSSATSQCQSLGTCHSSVLSPGVHS